MSTIARTRSTATTRFFDEQWDTTYSNAEISIPRRGTATGAAWLLEMRNGDTADQNAVLHDLLKLAAEGNDGATHTILRLMTPAVLTFSRTIRSTRDVEDRVAMAMSTAWITIRSFEFGRVEKYKATLSMRIFRQLVHDDARDEFTVTDDMLNELIEPLPDPSDSYIGVLTWALDMKILDRDEVALFARVVLGEGSRKEIADDMGIEYDALAKRYTRTRAKLALGIREHIATFGSWN